MYSESTNRVSHMTKANTQNQEHQGTTLEMILRSVGRGRQDGQRGPEGDDPDFCLRSYFDYAESSTAFSSPRTRPNSPSMVGNSDNGTEVKFHIKQNRHPQGHPLPYHLPGRRTHPGRAGIFEGFPFIYATRTIVFPIVVPNLCSNALLYLHGYYRTKPLQ